MCDNGSNNWNVPFSHISWLGRALSTHGNISKVTRSRDIFFTVSRIRQLDELNILCLRKYTLGLTEAQSALAEFSETNIIYIGGNWSQCTSDAQRFCQDLDVQVCTSSELLGMLWKDEF